MGFNTALSGLNAASSDLQTTGNNIANANTTGFKKSRAEFADVYILGAGKTTPGSGVRVTEIAQNFSQGSMESTENVLDLAINGKGFFSLSDIPDGEPTAYTRSGAFQMDKDGYIVTDQGKYLYGWKSDFSQGALQVQTSKGQPKATSEVKMTLNLDVADRTPPVSPLDPANPETYNKATSVTVYDSLGNPHNVTSYFVSQNLTTPNQYHIYQYIDGAPLDPTPTVIDFDTNGSLVGVNGTPGTARVTYPPFPAIGADPIVLTYDYAESTQFNSAFSINALSQNGFPAGEFTGLRIDEKGVMLAQFNNGNSQRIGQIALARFQNEQGLAKAGDTMWQESSVSGEKLLGVPGESNLGSLRSNTLESSNVDLSAQLVRLIIAQQSYQANAETISTEDQVIQTLLNIR